MYKKSDRIALFISVLLHSLLVFFPWKETPRPSTVSSTPTDSISVVELPTLPAVPSRPPAPVPPPSPPVPVPPPSPPVPVVPPSPLVATPAVPPADLPPEAPSTETSDRPTEKPAPETDPEIDLPPETPNTETNEGPIDPVLEVDSDTNLLPEDPSTETNDSPIDEAKIAADWENWVSHLQRQNQEQGFESLPLLDVFNFFGEPEQVNQFFDENNQPKLDVSSFYLFPEQTPEQVLQTVVIPELTSNTGFDLQPQENVSAGLAYQLSQGEMRRYFIIVRLNERSGSVLMLSNSLLGLES